MNLFHLLVLRRLGLESKEQLLEILGKAYKTFLRNQFAENTTDYYFKEGFFVEYDKNDSYVAIEFTNDCELYFNDRNLMKMTYNELRSQFDKQSKSYEIEEGSGVTYFDLGF